MFVCTFLLLSGSIKFDETFMGSAVADTAFVDFDVDGDANVDPV